MKLYGSQVGLESCVSFLRGLQMVLPEIPWVDGLTIGQVLRETARKSPDQVSVIFPSLSTQFTWGEFDRAVDQAAKSLIALGFQRGDHFGVWASNCPAWLVLQFATARIGVV